MNRKHRHKWLIFLCSVLAVILLVLIFLTVYAGHLLSLIGRYDSSDTLSPQQAATATEDHIPPNPDFSGIVVDPTDITFPTDLQEIPQATGLVNILLIGQDRREGESRQRSDAMILCSINPSQNTITLVSFLRDTYLPIPGYHSSRLNSAYQWGGMGLLKRTISENFGVAIDACVEVDFSGFQKIIDILGGVSISLTSAEARYLHTHFGWPLNSGENQLTGEQALAYARIRAIGNDFGRAQRQRTVISSLIAGIRKADLGTLLSLTHQILPLITTDMTNGQILHYVTELSPILSGATEHTGQIPATGTYRDALVNGMAVLIPDLEKNRELLSSLLSGS